MAPRGSQNKRDTTPTNVRDLRGLYYYITMMEAAKGTMDAAAREELKAKEELEAAREELKAKEELEAMEKAGEFEKGKSAAKEELEAMEKAGKFEKGKSAAKEELGAMEKAGKFEKGKSAAMEKGKWVTKFEAAVSKKIAAEAEYNQRRGLLLQKASVFMCSGLNSSKVMVKEEGDVNILKFLTKNFSHEIPIGKAEPIGSASNCARLSRIIHDKGI